MQRVLSFPVSTSFGESSELVTKRMCFSFMFSIGFIALLSGFLLGRFALDQELAASRRSLWHANQLHQQVSGSSSNATVISMFIDSISKTDIRGYIKSLRELSTPDVNTSLRQAVFLREKLQQAGFNLLSPLSPHHSELSYPDPNRVNQAVIFDGSGTPIFACNDSRPPLKAADGQAHVVLTSSTVKGTPLYVNFGRDDDYFYLDSINIQATGRVVLARVGQSPPLDMVSTALEHGVAGILMYLDPQQEEMDPPMLNAGDLADLQKINGVSFNPDKEGQRSSVPVLVISAAHAERILIDMSAGESSPDSWRGSFRSSYPLGPGFSNKDWTIEMHVNTINLIRTHYNVVAGIPGSFESDRHVVLSLGRDPWVNSDLDITGSAMLLELAKLVGVFVQNEDWQPRRSIIFAFWGLSGREATPQPISNEWWSQVSQESVAYLDFDLTALGAESTSFRGTPLFEDLYERAAKSSNWTRPMDIMLDAGGVELSLAELPFLKLHHLGHVDLTATVDDASIDAIARVFGTIMWELTENRVLPFQITAYTNFLKHSISVLMERFDVIARRHTLFLDTLTESVNNLVSRLEAFDINWQNAEKPLDIRRMNDQMLLFVRSFICSKNPNPFNANQLPKHAIFSRSNSGKDKTAGFGLLQDLLREMTSTQAPDDLHQKIVTLLADLVVCLQSAERTLADPINNLVLWNT